MEKEIKEYCEHKVKQLLNSYNNEMQDLDEYTEVDRAFCLGQMLAYKDVLLTLKNFWKM